MINFNGMTQYIVNVPDNQISFFTELMDKLNIALDTPVADDLIVPEWHKEIVRERRKNTKREDYTDWNVLESQLDKKYGVK